MTIAIGADHAGYELKEQLRQYLEHAGHTVANFGTNSPDSVDYPDFAHPLAVHLTEGKAELGVLICGSANGVCMTANKHAGIRGAIAWQPELARLAREHNNANVLCLPARFITPELAIECVAAFLEARFEGGRHQRRVEKIPSP
jgi:ribose 5-phosphate isomerase B